MQTLLLSLQIILALVIILLVLVQRSEGGALGIGGGGPGAFMSGRGAANFLTRLTAVLGACFFAVCLGLALLAQRQQSSSVFDSPAGQEQQAPLPPLQPLRPLSPPES